MNNKIIALLFLGMVAFSCDKSEEIQLNGESLTENDLDICKNAHCPEITVNYLKVLGDGKVAKRVNSTIENFIISSLSLGENENLKGKSIKEAAADFAKIYFSDKKNFPDISADYFAEISVSEIYNTVDHICLEMRQYLFTGGAHGYGTASFYNFDPRTGEELTFDELFKNKKAFMEFAENKFREQQKIDNTQSINDPGFWFEDDTFSLPNSVGFTQDSLIFVYNQYDIASFADGPIELRISINDAKPFLNRE